MLSSKNLCHLTDFPVSKEVFPGVEIKGGVSYFLWSRDFNGDCLVTQIRGNDSHSNKRKLDEFDVFVRNELSASILRKVLIQQESKITEILTNDTPFGIATNFDAYHEFEQKGDLRIFYVKKGKRNTAYIPETVITKNRQLIHKWKVLVPEAGSDGGQRIPDAVLGKTWIAEPNSVCTQSFLAFFADSLVQAKSIESYVKTKFFDILFLCVRLHNMHFTLHTPGSRCKRGIESGRMKSCIRSTG